MNWLKKLFGGAGEEVNFSELLQNGSKIIDVRSPGEFKSGHLKGSLNFPVDSLSLNIKTLKHLQGPLILVCRSGNRASMAKRTLGKHGIVAHNAGAWQNLNQY